MVFLLNEAIDVLVFFVSKLKFLFEEKLLARFLEVERRSSENRNKCPLWAGAKRSYAGFSLDRSGSSRGRSHLEVVEFSGGRSSANDGTRLAILFE